MKTTIEIGEDLYEHAQKVAQREGKTLQTLVEEGLRTVLAHREQGKSYEWPDLSVTGEGLVPEIEEGTWEALRDRIFTAQPARRKAPAGGDRG